MKTKAFTIVAAALFILVCRPCFAEWGVATVSKDEIKNIGAEFHVKAAGPDDVRVEFEFNTEGKLKGFSRVDLRLGAEGDSGLTATLKEDRSTPGRIAVAFSAHRTFLERIQLWVFLPGNLGGSIYEFRVKDFVDLKDVR